MSIFHLFEQARRENAHWYTQNPLDALTDEELAAAITRLGLEKTVDELRAEAQTPHVEMTCALCGRPQTHLISCPGCGREAWGWEWEMVYGGAPLDAATLSTHAANQLRAHTRPALVALGHAEAQIDHGLRHAWQMGGCMICAECWHHTLPAEAYQICPLNLISIGHFNPRAWPAFLWPLFETLQAEPDETKRLNLIATELARVTMYWIKTWNTVADPDAHAQVLRWRTGLMMAYNTINTAPAPALEASLDDDLVFLQGEAHE